MRFTRPSGSETAGWCPDASGRFFRDPQQKNRGPGPQVRATLASSQLTGLGNDYWPPVPASKNLSSSPSTNRSVSSQPSTRVLILSQRKSKV